MASITIRYRHPLPTGTTYDQLFPTGRALLDGWGRRALADVQRRLWAVSRFKRPTGKSNRAWKVETDYAAFGLLLTNAAENRYGTRYARFVHLAGRPKTEKLVYEVQAYMDTVIGPELIKALGRDYKRGLKTRPRPVTTRTFKG